MAILVTDPRLAERLKTERRLTGADRYDEIWEGVYMMAPLPDNEHQRMVLRMAAACREAVEEGGLGEVFAGVNLTDREGDWQYDFRAPDVAVFLKGGKAEDCGTYWRGAADFLVEVTSPEDRVHEKLPFYSRLGVRELLVVNRSSWTLELYRWEDGALRLAGQTSAEATQVLLSQVVPLRFELTAGSPRPRIEVGHVKSGRKWVI